MANLVPAVPLVNPDPMRWSIEQVVKVLEPLRLPQSTIKELRDNDIDGRAFLKHISLETLKADIGIKSLGVRGRIMEIVEELRLRSDDYQARNSQRIGTAPNTTLPPVVEIHQSLGQTPLDMPFIRSHMSLESVSNNRTPYTLVKRVTKNSGPLILHNPLNSAEVYDADEDEEARGYVAALPAEAHDWDAVPVNARALDNKTVPPQGSAVDTTHRELMAGRGDGDGEDMDTPPDTGRSMGIVRSEEQNQLIAEWKGASEEGRVSGKRDASKKDQVLHQPWSNEEVGSSVPLREDSPDALLERMLHDDIMMDIASTQDDFDASLKQDIPTTPGAIITPAETPVHAGPKRIQPVYLGPVDQIAEDTLSPMMEVEADLIPENIDTEIITHRKRIQPTFIGPIGDDEDVAMRESEAEIETQDVQTIEVRRPRRKRYKFMEGRGFPVRKIFYGNLKVGEPLYDEKPEDFIHVMNPSSAPSPATSRFIAKKLFRSFLYSQQIYGYTASGVMRVGVRPFPDWTRHQINEFEPVPVTVIEVDEDSCAAFIGDDLEYQFPWDSEDYCQQFPDSPEKRNVLVNVGANDIRDWDFLEKWNHIGDDSIIPALREGEEHEYDSETWAEIQEEENEKIRKENAQRAKNKAATKAKAPPLSLHQVHSAIEKGKELIRENWARAQQPKWEKRRVQIWKRHARTKTRSSERQACMKNVAELKLKVDKQMQEIAQLQWYDEKDVLRQCKSMEEFIYQQEENLWLYNLLKERKEPKAPQTVPKPQKAHPLVKEEDEDLGEDEIDGSEEEIDIDTDSEDGYVEGGYNDDELDGFIVSDNEFDKDEQGRDIIPDPVPNDDTSIATIGENRDSEPSSDSEVEFSTVPRSKKRAASPAKSTVAPRTPFTASESQTIDLTLSDEEEEPVVHIKNPGSAVKSTAAMAQRSADGSPASSNGGKSRVKTLESFLKGGNADGYLEYMLDQLAKQKIIALNLKINGSDFDVTVLSRWIQDHYKSLSQAGQGKRKADTTGGLTRKEYDIYCTIANLYSRCKLSLRDDFAPLSTEDRNKICRSTEIIPFLLVLKSMVKKRIDQMDMDEDDDYVEPKRRNISAPIGDGAVSRGTRKDELVPEIEGDSPAGSNTPSKRRKQRNIVEDTEAATTRHILAESRRKAERRQRDQEKRVREGKIQVNEGAVQINIGKFAAEAVINAREDHGRFLKRHQIEGVRFLWRTLIRTAAETKIESGALLSHTMGLGKTFQVIAFLYTLVEAALSKDPKVIQQIPDTLRGQLRILVLCPPGLVENWYEEFWRWGWRKGQVPDFGIVRSVEKLEQSISPAERVRVLEEWHRDGGVLIVGYTLFRKLFSKSNTKDKETAQNTQEFLEKTLLDGPQLVVADEAHEMKNEKTQINILASRFKTKFRIAMTGSPLSNNLREYYNMIEWIHPGYLGPFKEFDNKYIVPINNGLYADSTASEKRTSLKTLELLKKDVSMKVDRKDITAIKEDLPQKKEFLISIPLTDLQDKLYREFLEAMDKAGSRSLFDLVIPLQLLCNHPAILRASMAEKDATKSRRKSLKTITDKDKHDADADNPATPDLNEVPDENVRVRAISSTWLEKVLNQVKDVESENYSYRVLLLKEILDESIRDPQGKVLVFSHSIQTLNFLQMCIKKWGWNCARLDGSTVPGERTKICKAFNKGDQKIMLVSTKAGGLGLNMPGANRVVIFDFQWTPTAEEQAVGRAYRLGQEQAVFVYRFMAGGTFERMRRNKAEFKTQLATRVVDKKDPMRSSLRAFQKYSAPPSDVPQEDVDQFKGRDKVLDRLLSGPLKTYIRSIDETDTFKEDDEKLTEEDEREIQHQLEQQRRRRENGFKTPPPENPASVTVPTQGRAPVPIPTSVLVPIEVPAAPPVLVQPTKVKPGAGATPKKPFSGTTAASPKNSTSTAAPTPPSASQKGNRIPLRKTHPPIPIIQQVAETEYSSDTQAEQRAILQQEIRRQMELLLEQRNKEKREKELRGDVEVIKAEPGPRPSPTRRQSASRVRPGEIEVIDLT